MRKTSRIKKNAILASPKNLKAKVKKRVVEEEEEEEEEVEEAPVVKKRGRPRKVKVEEEVAEVEEAPVVKRRGRPRKNAAETAKVAAPANKASKKAAKNAELVSEDTETVGQVINIPLDEIILSEDIELTDEITLDEKVVEDLSKAIPKDGLLNPLTVALIDGEHVLIAGRHRLEALKRIRENKATTFKRMFKNGVPVSVATTDLGRAKFLRVAENLHRRKPNDVEFAIIINSLVEEGIKTEDIAKAFCKSVNWVRDRKRFYEEAGEEIKERLQAGEISFKSALKLMKVSEEEQAEAVEEVVAAKKGSKHGRDGGATEKAVAARTGKAVAIKPSKKQLVDMFNNLVQKAIAKSQHENAGSKRYSSEELVALSAQTLRYAMGEISEEAFRDSITKPKLTLKTILNLGGND